VTGSAFSRTDFILFAIVSKSTWIVWTTFLFKTSWKTWHYITCDL